MKYLSRLEIVRLEDGRIYTTINKKNFTRNKTGGIVLNENAKHLLEYITFIRVYTNYLGNLVILLKEKTK